MRNVLIALTVIVVGVGAMLFFYKRTLTEIPDEVMASIKNNSPDRNERILWIAQKFGENTDFWQRMIRTPDPVVRRAIYSSLARIRRNVPDCYFPIAESLDSDKADVLELYSAMIYIAPWCDLRMVPRAMGDVGGTDPELSQSAYSYLAFQSVEDWTPDETKASLQQHPIATRWLDWWDLSKSMDRRSYIDYYTKRLLVRLASGDKQVYERAFQPLKVLYGDDAYNIPASEENTSLTDAERWWEDNKVRLLDKVMGQIEWDRFYYKDI